MSFPITDWDSLGGLFSDSTGESITDIPSWRQPTFSSGSAMPLSSFCFIWM